MFYFRDDERLLKNAFILCVGMYFFSSAAIGNYAAAVSSVVVTTALSLIREKKSGQNTRSGGNEARRTLWEKVL